MHIIKNRHMPLHYHKKQNSQWLSSTPEQQKELQETISRLSDMIVRSKNGKSAKDVDELDKEMAERGGEFLAELLNLPSKNYVPEKLRGKDINGNKRTDIDEEEANKEEYDAEKARKILIAERNAESETQETDSEKTVTESQKQEADRKKPVTEKDEDNKNSNPLGRLIPTAHAAEPQPDTETQEEDMQTDKNTTETETQPETQAEQEAAGEKEKVVAENDKTEKADEITHAEGDPLNYSHVSNKDLEEMYGVKIRNLDIDERVIFSVEKGQDYSSIATEGYIPIKNRKTGEIFSSSGVTIGFGFDIGQRDEAELRRIFGNSPLFEKLRPYAEQKGEKAVKILEQKPLVLTEGEALAVTRAVYANINETVRGHFDKEKGKGAYDKLDRDYKTAMLSHYMFRGQNSMLGNSDNKDSGNDTKTDVWYTVINNTGDIEALAKTIYYKDGSKGRGKKIAKHFQEKYDEDKSWSEWLK